MKCGTTSSVIHLRLAARIATTGLRGKLSITCVSDEERERPAAAGAPATGSRHPEYVRGGMLPERRTVIGRTPSLGRESGPLWLAFTVKTRGAHGAISI